jgi:hypothetical protein
MKDYNPLFVVFASYNPARCVLGFFVKKLLKTPRKKPLPFGYKTRKPAIRPAFGTKQRGYPQFT